MNCVAYALSFNSQNEIVVDWARGAISGRKPVPLAARSTQSSEANRKLITAHLERLMDGNRSTLVVPCRCDGIAFLIRDIAQPEFDKHGRVVRIVGVVEDVTAKFWEQGKNDTDIWKSQICDHLDFGLSGWDLDGKLAFANRRFLEIDQSLSAVIRPGISIRTLIALLSRSPEVLVRGDRRLWRQRLRTDFEKGRPCEILLADGRWLEFTTIQFTKGSIVRTLDITSQKGGERALRQAKEIAESANLKKSRFLRAANHDLRQPLATLKILIYSSFGIDDETKREELLHSMDVTVGIMDEILGSLLQIGQLDAGRIVAKVSHFQLKQVLERLRIEFTPQAETKGLRLRIVQSHETVMSDRALLERILSNFLSNAIRFTEVGTILVGPRRRGSAIEIEVWDTGCGIPDDQFDLVFEEFQQVGDQDRNQQRGLGLGLNIAQRLAELLDHKLNVRSQLGRGSVFSVSVPFGDLWQSDLGEPEISERIGGEFLGVKMLVVEDNELLRRTVCLMLEKWGVEIAEACNAETAVKLFSEKRHDFDIALVDYRLPNGRAGTDVLADLRRMSGRFLPGIVATADNDPTLINRFRAEGLPVLIKPINPVRLRSVMHYLLYEQDH